MSEDSIGVDAAACSIYSTDSAEDIVNNYSRHSNAFESEISSTIPRGDRDTTLSAVEAGSTNFPHRMQENFDSAHLMPVSISRWTDLRQSLLRSTSHNSPTSRSTTIIGLAGYQSATFPDDLVSMSDLDLPSGEEQFSQAPGPEAIERQRKPSVAMKEMDSMHEELCRLELRLKIRENLKEAYPTPSSSPLPAIE